ncbi:Cell surface superoxide dismutase [Cu-Zn] 4 [Cladophialophora carrionii]|uniref:superoxide dismutase n=1 Tax=Cladophialophora carrionii TaxID=86049 RepID=A0A1C1CT55_9EURO|nr:Cell surface superoxide dismutase [Cu-Zn] 4 [Cladophialophora carrionii]
MISLTFLATLALQTIVVFAQGTNDGAIAPIPENNPSRVTFQGVFQSGKPVQGQITGVSNDNGTGVSFSVNFFSFPDVGLGPFNYHIHEYPIPPSGNCTAAGGHLSPFGRSDTPPCDPVNPQTCQPGDLSGKHGNISQLAYASAPDGSENSPRATNTFQAMYLELYLSTDPNNAAFFGNRSVVVHAANGTRLNCANFTQMMPTETFGGTGSGNTTSSGGSTSTQSAASNGSARVMAPASLALMLLVGALVGGL